METHVAWREVHAPWQMAERAEKGHSGQAGLSQRLGDQVRFRTRKGRLEGQQRLAHVSHGPWRGRAGGRHQSGGAHTQGLTFAHRRGRAWWFGQTAAL